MSSFQQVLIGGYPSGGLTTDKKPLMLPDQAFSELRNAYVWRDRTKKRLGTVFIGRLRRVFSSLDITTVTSGVQFNLYSSPTSPITPETYAQVEPGSVRIILNPGVANTGTIIGYNNSTNCEVFCSAPTGLVQGDVVNISGVVVVAGSGDNLINGGPYVVSTPTSSSFTINKNSVLWAIYASGGTWTQDIGTITLIDQGNGTLATNPASANTGVINYITGNVTLTFSGGPYAAAVNFNYFPSLQAMGISKQDIALIGVDQTVFFDTKYAYQYSNGFQELVPGTTWTAPNNVNGTNTYFFWTANYQGANPSLRYFFATNDYINPQTSSYDPIRYYDPTASTWTALTPAVDASNFLFQARIIIPYYGRLVALNVWEGTAVTPGNAVNYFARCRFSQIGDPTSATAWRSDQFGKGGFLDAPTNEEIIGAAFYRNTLVVFFEYSTWQLRYIGEYGLPFIFERISSDFGSTCTFSSILFDQGVMAVGGRGIIQAGAQGVTRLDEQIPETVFSFEIQNNAPNFVHGVRDFEKELVYWNYLDSSDEQKTQVFPNTTLLFNYKNNTWAQFRDTITCFGIGQFQFGITWDSQTSWESEASWDDSDDQEYVDYVLAGNQQGFISVYENQDASTDVGQPTMFGPSLAIYAVDFTAHPNKFTVPNHNLANEEIIYITDMLWSGTDPLLNNTIYRVTVFDQNTITLGLWNGVGYTDINKTSSAVYIGGGLITLFPKMDIVGKDFNPFQGIGKQFKLSFIDFQMDSNLNFPGIPAVTIQLFVNSYLGEQANLITGNQELITTSQQVGIISRVYAGAGDPASLTNPCTILSYNHSLTTGNAISIANVVGTTQVNTSVSLISYVITVIDANYFSLNGINSSAFTTYISGGTWNTLPMDGQVYIPGSQYAWYRFYSTQFGQYLRVAMTYDDELMNQLSTHQLPVEMNAMVLWMREGGRLVN